jgi:hypothetical protein
MNKRTEKLVVQLSKETARTQDFDEEKEKLKQEVKHLCDKNKAAQAWMANAIKLHDNMTQQLVSVKEKIRC